MSQINPVLSGMHNVKAWAEVELDPFIPATFMEGPLSASC